MAQLGAVHLHAGGRSADAGRAAALQVHFETTKTKVLTLKADLRYWPTWQLRLDPGKGEWTREVVA